jgi:site-specific DNA-cytosine methylase
MKSFASLCSGFGLMDVGAIQAGFQPIWGVEIDPKLAEVASANLKHRIYVKSIAPIISTYRRRVRMPRSPPTKGKAG